MSLLNEKWSWVQRHYLRVYKSVIDDPHVDKVRVKMDKTKAKDV